MAATLHGKFFMKNILGNPHSVFKCSEKVVRFEMPKEARKVRRSLDHKNIVKYFNSYTEERGSLRCFVLEPLLIPHGSLATVAQQRTRNLREFNIWRSLARLSSALSYLHSHPNGPVLAQDLSPHTVIDVYRTEEERKAHLVWWKLLLLGAGPESSVSLLEVVLAFYHMNSLICSISLSAGPWLPP